MIFVRLTVGDAEEFCENIRQSAAPSRPFAPGRLELQMGLVVWIKENKPELLECEVKKFVRSKGGWVIWSPLHCANLQPIEVHWANGKNFAADCAWTGRSMKQTVQLLREGWHGNAHLRPGQEFSPTKHIGEDRMIRRMRLPVDCAGLARKAESQMNDLFIGIAGFGATIDNLQVPPDWEATLDETPMNLILSKPQEQT